jgi:hypothetical protein
MGVRIDQAGESITISELLARFAGQTWLYEITELHETEQAAAEAAGTVRLYPHGLTTQEPIETGNGHYVVVVDGDLVTSDHAEFHTIDYEQSRVIVTGNMRARSLSYANGARVMVEGSAEIERACIGRYGDRNAVFGVGGQLTVPIVLIDRNTTVDALGGLRALIYSAGHFWRELKPDIDELGESLDDESFRPEYLDEYGDLDLVKAIAAARAGETILLPGVAESYPDRLRFRHTR